MINNLFIACINTLLKYGILFIYKIGLEATDIFKKKCDMNKIRELYRKYDNSISQIIFFRSNKSANNIDRSL